MGSKPHEQDNQRIVLLTLQFPFGASENFLETEIKHLAKSYQTVYILPSDSSSAVSRPVPENVIVLTPLSGQIPKFDFKFILLNLWPIFSVYLYSLRHSKYRIQYLKHYKSLLHYFHRDFSHLNWINECIDRFDLQSTVFYDYWMLNKSLTLIFLKAKKKISRIVVRAHRFDLYNDQHFEGIVPFKEFRVAKIDIISTISLHGYNYLKNEFSEEIARKLELHYLGVDMSKKIPINQTHRIVSCSSLLPFKQVDQIALSIKHLPDSVEWIHFGDGSERTKIEEIIQSFPSNIKVSLLGACTNEFILNYYAENYVSVFISLSTSEGLPVSMMEAQSYGIPIVAPSINGIPEIVNETTGVLLNELYSLTEVTNILSNILNGSISFDRQLILNHFEDKFQAMTNYPSFINNVLKV
jgi:glycosyltransferase involved in cell wall biosynthesis